MIDPPLRVALIASARYPICQPFAGGLEAQTWMLAHGLHRRGHQVTLFAAPGTDPTLTARLLDVDRPTISLAAARDVSMPPGPWLEEHHAYLTLMLRLMQHGAEDYDVVHNNSLHYLPLAMARSVTVPMITTLHTPPTPWLESAITSGPCPVTFTAVSAQTATAWQHVVPRAHVVMNGIDLDVWRPGPGGGPLVWFGRLVSEKGPDLAIRAARQAGLPLQLIGPISDPAFFATRVQPLLGSGIEYLGHLPHAQLADLVGRARATLVTPRWDEPYGLVAAESLACGTPVIGFARGGLPEVVDQRCAILVRADNIGALVSAASRWASLSRAAARDRATCRCSADTMITAYEQLYRTLTVARAA
ncbi:MAG: glycosyltransferase family 4 protein [Actinomycetota bacterium]|nr:glycosyltransferase family 4 protein [Actinomycetota bacterium]